MQGNNSLNANLIITRLKKSLKIKTDIELSQFLTIKPNTISTWKKRNSVDFNSIIAICELYEIDLNYLLLGKEFYKEMDSAHSTETVLVSKEILFQYILGTDKGLLDNLPRYNFPFVKSDATRAFQIMTNNMFPTLEENSFAICEEANIANLQDDKIYIIISRKKGMFVNRVKLIPESDQSIQLINDNNPHARTLLFDLADIDELWKVKSVMSCDINNTSNLKYFNNKINTLESFVQKIKNSEKNYR